MSMTRRERAARAVGWLEGFGAWVWASAGERLADETAAGYDMCVEELRKALFEGGEGEEE